MHNKSVVLLLFLSCLIFACNKGSEGEGTERKEEEQKMKTEKHIYYFSQVNDEGGKAGSRANQNKKRKIITQEASNFEKVPEREKLSWVDSIRVSGLGFFNKEPFFVVNKVGIFSFSNIFSFPLRIFSNQVFPLFSASDLYNTDVGFLLRSYKTNIFDELNNAEEEIDANFELPILSRYNSITQDLEVIFFPHHFALPYYATLTSLTYSDAWYASFKIGDEEKVEFRYFKFDKMSDILNATYKPVTEATFRKAVTPLKETDEKFSLLPKPFIQLFKEMKENNVLLEYFDSNNLSSVKLARSKSASFEDIDGEGMAFCNASYSAILLGNGKLYLSTRKDKDWGSTAVYSLPHLPANFIYKYFAIYDDVLLASWEEEDFYECGRAGFITIPLSMLEKEKTNQ